MKRCQVAAVVVGLAVLGSGCSCSNIAVAWPDSGSGGGAAGGGEGGGTAGGSAGGGSGQDAGACRDRDGDGFGIGDCLGLDCDDSDPLINKTGMVRCFSFDAGLVRDGGACKGGTALCTAGVLGPCLNEAGPGPEQCNGLDDDCNGAIDDGVAPVGCYGGPPGSLDAGSNAICRSGLATCVKGVFGSCAGEVLPTAEVCANAKDDNCDGRKDEAPCASGTYVCSGCAGAADTNPGTQNAPVATIGQGIANAVALSTSAVFVAGVVDGQQHTYTEDVTIPNGVIVQGRWAVTTGGASNAWSRTAERALLTNATSSGVKFAPGATRGSGLDGLAIQAVSGGNRVVGISIINASPVLKDFAVLSSSLTATPPAENLGVLVSGTLLAPAFPRLEGAAAGRSEVKAGAAAIESAGIRVANARLELAGVNALGGTGGAGVSAGLHLINSPQSDIREAELNAGLATTCVGFFSQQNASGILVQNVAAAGCPATSPGSGTTPAVTGVGIAFEACPMVASGINPVVKNSSAVGGTTTGPKSIATGAAAVDGCHVVFSGNTLTGGVVNGTIVPETEIGLHCGYQGIANAQGKDASCRATGNIITAGSAASPIAVGMNCVGSCESKAAACEGSCSQIGENTISATNGKTLIHLSIVDSSPVVTANRIGFGSNVSALGACNNSSVFGVSLDGSGATLVNNLITGGPCLQAIGISQANDLRTGDSSVVGPTVHFNTIVASGAGVSPLGATSIGVQLSGSAAVPATLTPRGIYRNNLIVAGPVAGTGSVEVVVREGDAKSDPATFWNNLLHVPGATIAVLYLNEVSTPIITAAGVNGLTDISAQGNFSALPLFVAPATGDYHISATSPARGAATSTAVPPIDFDGQGRPNPVGGNPDVGADEVP